MPGMRRSVRGLTAAWPAGASHFAQDDGLPPCRLAGEDDTRDALQVVDEADGGPAGEQCGEGVMLAVTDLECEQAVGCKGGAGLGDEAAIDGEAILASEESRAWFVVADLGMEGCAVGFGNVGRVGDEYFVPFSTGFAGGRGFWCIALFAQAVEQVGFEEGDAAGQVMAGGVFTGDGERGGRDVGGGDLRLRQMVCERDGDRAGAGADVEDSQWNPWRFRSQIFARTVRHVWVERGVSGSFDCGAFPQARDRTFAHDDRVIVVARIGQLSEDGFDEVFGFRARDEDGGRDAEGEAEEFLLAGDVLDGFVVQAARDGGFIGGLVFQRDLAIRISIELRAGDAEGVQQQRERVTCGCVAQVARGCELSYSSGEGLGESCQLELLSCEQKMASRSECRSSCGRQSKSTRNRLDA
jgi:hypothetical protein